MRQVRAQRATMYATAALIVESFSMDEFRWVPEIVEPDEALKLPVAPEPASPEHLAAVDAWLVDHELTRIGEWLPNEPQGLTAELAP